MADIFALFRQIAKKDSEKTEPVTWLVAGLGNPGKQYENTRHNAGFLALDNFASKLGVSVKRSRFHSLVGDATVGGIRVLLMKPQTMMNASGLAVGEAADFYKIQPDHILVISDDISLPVGHLRVRRKGSAGGHNGLKDIIACLGSEDFQRIRIGIGSKPNPDYDLADWVLSSFSEKDRQAVDAAFSVIGEGIRLVLEGKTEDAMQICNSFKTEDDENR